MAYENELEVVIKIKLSSNGDMSSGNQMSNVLKFLSKDKKFCHGNTKEIHTNANGVAESDVIDDVGIVITQEFSRKHLTQQ